MAKTRNPMRITGTINGLSFVYHPVYGYYVREKGGPDREQIFTKPSFAKTRENINRFGLASRCGKDLRRALEPLTRELQDTCFHNRVQKAFIDVILKSESFTHEALLKQMHHLDDIAVNNGNTLTQLHICRPVVHSAGVCAELEVRLGSAPIRKGDICVIRGILVSGDIVSGEWKKVSACELKVFGMNKGEVRAVQAEFPVSSPVASAMLCMTAQFCNEVNGNVCWYRDQHMYAGKLKWVRGRAV